MKKAAREFWKWRACQRKTPFETKEAAYQKGQEAYRCRYCKKWHRASKWRPELEVKA